MNGFLSLSALSFAVLFLFEISSPALAQDKAPAAKGEAKEKPAAATAGNGIPTPLIAVIDVQAILRESTAAAALREQIDAHRRKNRDEIAKQEDALRDAQQELNRQRTVLSAEAFEKKRAEWQRQATELNQDLEKRKRQLDIAFERSLAKIQEVLVKIVRGVAEGNNINLVFAKSQILLVDPGMDITQSSLEGLNKQLPSVKLDFSLPKPAKKAATPEKGT